MGVVLAGSLAFGKVVIDELIDHQQAKARGVPRAEPPQKAAPSALDQVVQIGATIAGVYVSWQEFKPWMAELEKFLQ